MNEFQPINITDHEEKSSVIKKTKKVKSTLKGLTKKFELIIEDEEKSIFINQVFRRDILANMLANTKLTGKELFDMIMKENKELCDERIQGWLFETLCQILIILKCIENINYTEIYDGQLQNLKQLKNINSLLKVKVDGGGNHMLSIRKISQDISENTCKWIPLVPLDRIWSDDKVCEYLKIEQTMYI